MQTIGERIKLIRNENNLNQEQFARRIALSKSSISMIEKNKQGVSNAVIKLIINEFDLNRDWLINGTGEIHCSCLSDYAVHGNEDELVKMNNEVISKGIRAFEFLYRRTILRPIILRTILEHKIAGRNIFTPDMGDNNHVFNRTGVDLIIFRQPTGTIHPTKCTFYAPSFRDDCPTSTHNAFDNINR